MPWQLRHEGSPQALRDLTLQQIAEGLRDGILETTDEVMGPDDAGHGSLPRKDDPVRLGDRSRAAAAAARTFRLGRPEGRREGP